MIDAGSRTNRAETSLETAFAQVTVAEAAVREARASRVKAEAMTDPVKTLRRAANNRRVELNTLEQTKAPDAISTVDSSTRIADMRAEIDNVERYQTKAEATVPYLQGEHPTTRQATESLKDAEFSLDQTNVQSPVTGLITNFQLAEGTYASPGTPIASLIDTNRWRLVAAVPENWLELIRPDDRVIFSLRNYPGQVRSGKVQSVGRGVVQGQGVPSGNLADTDPRRTRQSDTPRDGQEFQVIVLLEDDQSDQPLRVGATGRMTILAGGGFPVVNELSAIIHNILSWADFLYPKPSTMMVVIGLTIGIGFAVYLRTRPALAPASESRV